MVRDATQPHTAFVGSPAFIPPEVLRDDARYNTKVCRFPHTRTHRQCKAAGR